MNRDIHCSWVVHYYKLHVIYLYKMFEIWSNIYFFFAQDELSIHVEGTIEGKPEEGKRKETRAGGTPSGVFRTTTAALVPTRMSNTGRAGAMKKGHAMISFTISLCNNCFEDKKYKAKYDYLMQLFKQSSQKNIQNIQIFTSWWMSSFAMRWDAAQKKERTAEGGGGGEIFDEGRDEGALRGRTSGHCVDREVSAGGGERGSVELGISLGPRIFTTRDAVRQMVPELMKLGVWVGSARAG